MHDTQQAALARPVGPDDAEPMGPALKVERAENQAVFARQCQAADLHRRYTSGLPSFVAGVVELVDAPDSKSGAREGVRVRVPPPAPGEPLLLNAKLC